MLISLLSFGLLPLVSLTFVPAILQDWYLRFVLNQGEARWDLGMQYNAMIALLLAYAAIMGFKQLLKHKWYKKYAKLHALITIAFVLIYHQFIYHGPLGMAYNRDFYRHTQDMQFLTDFIAHTPHHNRTIMAPNNLAVHLTHDYDVRLLQPEYWRVFPKTILLDIRPSQNP